MTAPSLAEFLLARIAEDEASIDGDWAGGDGGLHIISTPMRDRMMAECEAKRLLVARYVIACESDQSSGTFATVWTERHAVLAFLAMPYADHPDYDEEWKP